MKLRNFLAIAALLATPAAAQSDVTTTYFLQSSTTRHEMNPALLDQGYVHMPLVLGNMSFGTTGNVGLKNFVFKVDPSWTSGVKSGCSYTTFMNPNISADEFLSGLKDKNRISANLSYEIVGFAFKKWNGINSFGLSLKSNTSLSLPKDLFSFMKTAGQEKEYNISNFGLLSENYVEMALGHSHKIGDKVTVGAKVKFLFGLAYSNVKAKDVKFTLNDDKWTATGDIQGTMSLMGTDVKLSDETESTEHANGQTPRHKVDDIEDVKGGLGGFGLGFDLGATYKVTDDLTLSAALTDLGFISWKDAHRMSSAGEWEFSGFDADHYGEIQVKGDRDLGDQFDDLGDDLEDAFAVYYDGKKTSTHALAATLNIGAEYTLPAYRNLRFGFLYSSRLAGRYSYHQGRFSANIAPAKWFDAAVSLGFTSTGVQGGLVASFHAKHFNFSLGTDRFFGKLSKQMIPVNRLNSNAYVSISFPIGEKL